MSNRTKKALMYILIVAAASIATKANAFETATAADCTKPIKICDSFKSKPSGHGCTGLNNRSRKSFTTSKTYPGGRPALCGSGSRWYSDNEVKFIEQSK